MTDKDQEVLFGQKQTENDWITEYVEMPEYNNVKQPKPAIIAKFKFRNKEDYDKFHALVKKHIYDGKRVFDGMQRKDAKQAWYPLKEKASKYLYVEE